MVSFFISVTRQIFISFFYLCKIKEIKEYVNSEIIERTARVRYRETRC